VPAPHGGHAIGDGQLGIGMLRHIQHGKIVDDEGVGQAGKCNAKKHKLAIRQRARSAINTALSRAAPIIGNAPRQTAKNNATINAK